MNNSYHTCYFLIFNNYCWEIHDTESINSLLPKIYVVIVMEIVFMLVICWVEVNPYKKVQVCETFSSPVLLWQSIIPSFY